jgi:polyhydroxyalkanoate synthase
VPKRATTAAAPNPWQEIADDWQRAGAEWMRWWAGAASPGSASAPATPASAPGTTAARASIDPAALAALNARAHAQFDALWKATEAAAAADSSAAIPEIVAPAPGDRRFAAPEWSTLPYFALMKQSYLIACRYLTDLATLAPLPAPDKHRLAFATRQFVDAIAPSNYPATNPEVVKRAVATEGASLARGMSNLAADAQAGRITMSDARAFAVGRNLAVTPGAVVFRNELIELIQYEPTTPRVHRRPLLIVPPCINKYYILDLQPDNSFVRWAVGLGHTVFMISWRNVPPSEGRRTWDDYLEQGVLTALAQAKGIAATATVNALGFCVGGTLLACALAVLAARHDHSVESATFLTTMLDFADPGEIGVYVSREFLESRESRLAAGERIHGSELAGAFASLRANDLVWNYVVNNYLKGETPPAFDLLHWNGDSANLPGPMYVYFLRNLYLDNRLVDPGALTMAGEPIDLGRITVPTYVYASRDDHIVPWRAAYRTTALLGGEPTFVLGASGHIAGVVNPPAKGRRNYWANELLTDDPDDWLARARSHPGSWWPHWGEWLQAHGGALRPAPRACGDAKHPPICAAPGRYVLESA